MNKKLIFLMIIISILITGCNQEPKEVSEKPKNVEVITVKEQTMVDKRSYYGVIKPNFTKKFALKTSGTIDKIHFEIGDKISKGDLLVNLDDYDYTLAKKASVKSLELAKLELEKIKEAKEFYEDTYEDVLSLYKDGAISQNKLDEAKLQFDTKMKELSQAYKKVSQAQIDVNSKTKRVKETKLYSDMEGYIVDILNEEGEIISEGYPIIVARSEKNVVSIGIGHKDIKKVKVGSQVEVKVLEESYQGKVKKINSMPDELTRRYKVEIALNSGDFLIGESAKVILNLNEKKGIWLDINYILNDGVDYVYIVKNGRVTRRDIRLHEINGRFVRVTNLSEGEKVVINGTSSLFEGSKVKIVGDTNE